MTVYTDNPAGRLHEVLAAFHRNGTGQPIHSAWAAALNVPAGSPVFLRRYALLAELPGRIEARLARVDEAEFDRDQVMRWHGRVVSALTSGLFANQPSNQFAVQFDPATLASLEACSFVLHRHARELVLADGEVQRLRDLISKLDEELLADEGLDWELQEFLLFHVRAMAQALDEVPLSGTAALEHALDQAVGAGMRRARSAPARDTEHGAWRKFQDLIITVAAVLQIATAGLALPGQIQQQIEGPQPVQVEIVQSSPRSPAAPTADQRSRAAPGPAAVESVPSPAP